MKYTNEHECHVKIYDLHSEDYKKLREQLGKDVNVRELPEETINRLEEFVRLENTSQGIMCKGLWIYPQKDFAIYFDQCIEPSTLSKTVTSYLHRKKQLALEAHGKNSKENAKKLTPYISDENPTAINNGYEERVVKVTSPLGIHARPAARIVTMASKYQSSIYLRNPNNADRGDIEVNGKKYANAGSILSVLLLGVQRGTNLEIIAKGKDSKEALKSLEELISSKLEEE